MRREQESINPEETCFVISPIGEPNSKTRKRSDIVLETIIKPAAEENGLKTVRADQISAPGMITAQVIQHILNDRIVVADLTDQNPNVFYEYALRHAFQKPVVQLLYTDQEVPFNLLGIRTIEYALDLEGGTKARDEVDRQIAAALEKGYTVVSPVTMAAQLQALGHGPQDINHLILSTIQEQFDRLNNRRDQTEEVLQLYAGEIDLLKAVRYAGVTGICKRRQVALKCFSRAIDEESREIMVIGSSLKGLFQKEEYQEVLDKLRFKAERGMVHVKFLLTHPIVADFRAVAENRRSTEIGLEIINSLQALKEWNDQYCQVRLYLGTPTCFAIKTSNKMLINPYPYLSVSYDSPCLLLEYSPEASGVSSGYFFEEFNSAHFEAWDSSLSVQIDDYDAAIGYFRKMLGDYASGVETILSRGKSFREISKSAGESGV